MNDNDLGITVKTLKFGYDEINDVMTIEGVKFSGDFFRSLQDDSYLHLNEPFEIIKREKDIVHIHHFSIDELKEKIKEMESELPQ